ncbi:MAG: hypothetical protein KKH94_09325 [Candidatus Omnitrophica bacterium]|nr:hypothetical protein [Candidatus Omnitrophota bacterium]
MFKKTKTFKRVLPYILIFLFSITSHFLVYQFYYNGQPAGSSDFQHQYEPNVLQFIQCIQGKIDWADVQVTHGRGQVFHFGFLLFIVGVYVVCGVGNRAAVIIMQIILSTIIPMIFYRIAKQHYRSKGCVVFFTAVSMIFFDNIGWDIFISTECLYRVLFFPLYYMLLKLYFQDKNYKKFLLAFTLSFIVLVFTRMDTFILFIPMYVLCFIVLVRYLATKERVLCVALLVGIPFILNYFFDLSFLRAIVFGVLDYYRQGIVVHFFHTIEPFDTTAAHGVTYLIARFIKLCLYRTYEVFTIMPSRWSHAHQLQYAFFMSWIYILSLIGVARLWKTKNYYFCFFLFVYFVNIAMHVFLWGVTADLRTTYVIMPYVLLIAGYGGDYIWCRLRGKQ